MIKILTAEQTRMADANTIALEPISSVDLMERAAREFVNWFVTVVDGRKKVAIICGTGNNGGDGLAIARLLKDWSYHVKVYIVKGGKESEDFKVNAVRLAGKVPTIDVVEIRQLDLTDQHVVIDAIFGSGLSRPADGLYASVINRINEAPALRIAVDVPSGLRVDAPSEGAVVRADHTLTFHAPKLPFFFPSMAPFVGKWITADIELHKGFLDQLETRHYFTTESDARNLLKQRSTFSHKGNFGHALLVCGSFGKIGAAVLASRAALRAGTGLLTVHTPACGYAILQSTVPEAMVEADEREKFISSATASEKTTAIGIGPGLGQSAETVKAFRKLLEQQRLPMVIDADAINLLALHPELLHLVPAGSILTPHPKEFERIVGEWKSDFERLERQKSLARKLNSVIVLKGAFSSIASPSGEVYFNPTGNPGMATAGTGDVLTGILTALLAQSYPTLDAAVLGVFVHGLAGDLASYDKGKIGMIASDVIDYLPQAFRKLGHR